MKCFPAPIIRFYFSFVTFCVDPTNLCHWLRSLTLSVLVKTLCLGPRPCPPSCYLQRKAINLQPEAETSSPLGSDGEVIKLRAPWWSVRAIKARNTLTETHCCSNARHFFWATFVIFPKTSVLFINSSFSSLIKMLCKTNKHEEG